MTALSALAAVENSNKVWEKAKAALANATPLAQEEFKALKKWLATYKGNPDLRFTPFSGADVVVATDGHPVGAGTATVYGVYACKRADATASYLKMFDDGTDDNLSGLTAAVEFSIPFVGASVAAGLRSETSLVRANGIPIASGIRLASVTTSDGLTISTVEADAMDGFIISGA
jgi:hypothetical protein